MPGGDWRPAALDVEAMARDAQIDRIEEKIDHLIVIMSSVLSHPDATTFANGYCPLCGAIKKRTT